MTTAGAPMDFAVIGAQKAGTSSLTVYLGEHPELYVPQFTARFFDNDRYLRGLDWLRANLFRDAPDGTLRGTVTPQYMVGTDEALEQMTSRMAESVPRMRLVAIVRDPIDRAVSNYRMAFRRGDVTGTFDEVAAQEKRAIVTTGLYARPLAAYLRHFPAEQLLVITTEELDAQPGPTLARVFAHIGVDPSFKPPSMHEHIHQGGGRTRVDADHVASLMAYLDEHWFSKLKGGANLHARHGFGHFFERWNIVPDDDRPTMSDPTRARLQEIYLADAAKLEPIMGRLPPWVERDPDGDLRWRA